MRKRRSHARFLWVVAILALFTLPAQAQDAEPALLWPRLVEGMALGNHARPEVVRAARNYGRHAQQLTYTLVRSSPYLWHIVNAAEKRNMPTEIALLPAIESGFDNEAHSSRSAAGIWQFVPATARLYGLHDSDDYDARRDPMASTQAALNYLETLHDMYGDWLLALAAYNAGTKRVNSELRKSKTRNFWKLKLPKETRRHVANLLGLSLVVRHPDRYGLRLPIIPDKPVTEVVVLSGPVNLASAADTVGIPHESLTEYNPGLRDLRNTSLQRAVLMLPSDAEKLRVELSRADHIAVELPALSEPRPAPTVSKRHRVTAGETLWSIARRYSTSVDQLRALNRLTPQSKLKSGRTLIIASAE